MACVHWGLGHVAVKYEIGFTDIYISRCMPITDLSIAK